MNELMLQKKSMPLKSVAGALLFSVLLGPVGLLYASTLGGVVMIIFGFVAASLKLFVLLGMVWLGSCIWSVAAVNRYNKTIFLGKC